MKNKRILFLLSFCLSLAIAWGEIPPAKVIFQQYMNQAQTFANNFPREKAYLHFDNTSYYVGDTIWFKAYVTLAEKQTFSPISRPLYVELVDQTGHITDKQIIKLTQGEGNGQFVLPRSMLSGYYDGEPSVGNKGEVECTFFSRRRAISGRSDFASGFQGGE